MALISEALALHEADDPAVAIRLRVKDYLDGFRVGGQFLLVGVYEPSKDARTLGGIYLPDKAREEYRWQGVTGLVLKLGPLAYKTEKTADYFCDADGQPQPPKIGDWVMFDVKDARSFLLGKQPCRLVACTYVDAVVARPDMVA